MAIQLRRPQSERAARAKRASPGFEEQKVTRRAAQRASATPSDFESYRGAERSLILTLVRRTTRLGAGCEA
eukprot:6193989-Pleurochrysis_carterae.AAC.2